MTASAHGELWNLGATELATLIRSGAVSSREVVEAHLRRIAAVDPTIHAVTVNLAERALEEASAADRAAASGAELSPLHGVPFTVKENLDVVGTPTTQGLKALAEAYPGRDAPVVERLRAAGAIPIARTNMPSAAVRWHCESEPWGATVNPWDRSRTPGGSSGGEAAAIATGMSPLGLGSDGLGSLRYPAQCCGIAALKPTLGRVPQASSTEPRDMMPIGIQLTSVIGPLARNVADLRAAFELIAGVTWRDPWTVPAPLEGPALALPIHAALVLDPCGRGAAPQVQEGLRKAADALALAGYVVEESEPPGIDEAAEALLVMLSTPALRTSFEEVIAPIAPDPVQRFMAAFFEAAGYPDELAAEHAFITRFGVLRAWGEFQNSVPLILAPIATQPPRPAGTDLESGHVAEDIQTMRMTIAVNALGLPAVALPVGIADGVPQAVQIIAPRYREDLCLDAAAAIEQRLGILAPIDPH